MVPLYTSRSLDRRSFCKGVEKKQEVVWTYCAFCWPFVKLAGKVDKSRNGSVLCTTDGRREQLTIEQEMKLIIFTSCDEGAKL
jgi:hypothetical protein